MIDLNILEKAMVKSKYYIGTDTYDKKALCYCLTKKTGDNFEILLSKTMRDKAEFNQEVENLAKYFNAEIFLN